MPKFMTVATTDELEDQQAKLVEVEGQKIALFRVGEVFHALSDTCTHRGGPLSEGTVEGAEVTCLSFAKTASASLGERSRCSDRRQEAEDS
jgi:nitrite reductase (NADH) small subunit/3-phenylpropionate/trans-cinnamate dioxygenase ferredoxin subunit